MSVNTLNADFRVHVGASNTSALTNGQNALSVDNQQNLIVRLGKFIASGVTGAVSTKAGTNLAFTTDQVETFQAVCASSSIT